jgi:hypothetical protein
MIVGEKENIRMKFSGSHYIQLGHLFERILRSWEARQIQHLAPPIGPIINLPLERMITLTGALNGLLVVRSTRDFAVHLRNQRENTPLGRYPEEEVFEELISLFCLYLFHDFWRPHLFKVGPIHPFRSMPRDWPEENPTSTCSLIVDGFSVEIRLWLND